MKVLAILIILMALVIGIVPQFTNCEAGKADSPSPTAASSGMASAAPIASPAPATAPYRMMKCYWSAHAEIVLAVPLVAIGVLLFFARRKETTRALGILTTILGVLTILIPTSIVGTCLNDKMVCNTEMKPVLLISGGIVVALGVAALVVGDMNERHGDGGQVLG